MTTETPRSLRRYRRRIVGLGVLAFAVAFLLGALIFIPVVQNDLEDRVEQRLAADGVDGVTASFSGQDGTLTCAVPLTNPAAVEQVAKDLWGVRVVDLDPSCSASNAPVATDADPSSTSGEPTANSVDVPASSEPPLDSIIDLVDADPLFGQLSGLLETAGLAGSDGLGDDGPYTLLAPTDAAFDAAFADLDADGFEMLTTDPDLLRSVLLHHVADGEITSSELESGPLRMLDGTDVEVDADALTFTSGTSVAGVEDLPTQLDIAASNGVIHAIDHLLLPTGLELADPNDVSTTAAFDAGRLVLSGTVQSETQRQQVVAAVGDLVDPGNVDDQLVVDSAAVVADGDLARLAGLVAAMPANLVSGTAVLVGSELSLTGMYLDDGANSALSELGGSLDATLNLAARPAADAATAQGLQDELNEFVRLNPILFERSSTDLTPAAAAVIEQIAARATRLAGTSITIIGYTDTDGDADANQRLSQGRAANVLSALADQGLTAEDLQSQGLGEENPVLDAAGTEDQAASRRVEFVVTPR